MKNYLGRCIRAIGFTSLLLLGLTSVCETRAQGETQSPQAVDNRLTGEKAVAHLRQRGEYESLKKAYDAARESDAEFGATEPTTLVQQAKLLASDGTTDDHFGKIAIDGNRAIIGAYTQKLGANVDQGAAYIFARQGAAWVQEAKLVASDGGMGDYFGWQVGIKGNYALVGAPFDDIGANPDQGSAYVFVNANGVWTQQAKLTATDGAGGDRFGRGATAFFQNGNVYFAVGAPGARIGQNTGQGAVYVFAFQSVNYQQIAKLSSTGATPSYSLGTNVAHDGTTLAVSAEQENGARGAVYVFTGSGANWTQQSKLVPSDGASGDFFGYDVDIDGDRIVAGAAYHDVNGTGNQGAAYVFVRSGTNWSQQAKLTLPDGNSNDYFGSAVAISGNTLVVAAESDTVNFEDQGAAYIYGFSNGAWVQKYRLFAADGTKGDTFGFSVALAGDTLMIGAVDDDGRRGSAYVFPASAERFDYDGDGKTDTGVFRPTSGTWYVQKSTDRRLISANFGISTDKIVPADYDGDGKTDIAVFRRADGNWYWLSSSNGAFNAVHWGANGDVPMPAFFRDGDFKADLTVFRPSNGTWYIRRPDGSLTAVQWGQNGDIPIAADFFNEGLDNIAVFRPSNGTWYVRASNGSLIAIQWGANGDLPVVADYDGDGSANIAVFRPSNATWYIRNANGSLTAVQWGVSTDRPVAGDYDGDGRAEIAVFRPSNGTWYIRQFDGRLKAVQFGANGDLPLPASFIP